MNRHLITALDSFLRVTHLQYWPVRVRSGVAAGARWTLYPWSAYWRSLHEPALNAAVENLCDWTGRTCWDIGAHFGLYAVGLARRVGPDGQVAALEPNPQSFARLEHHRRMNRLHWLKPFQAAASDEAGTAMLYSYGTLKSTSTHLAYRGEDTTRIPTAIEVKKVKLDDLVASGELRLPSFVKVDAEGHGHHALAGARASLAAARPILVVGLHSSDEVNGVLNVLDPLRYEMKFIDGSDARTSNLPGKDVFFYPRD